MNWMCRGACVLTICSIVCFAASANLEIRPTAVNGQAIESANFRLLNPLTGTVVYDSNGLSRGNIVYGKYTLEVRAFGFKIHRQLIYIYQEQIVTRMRMAISQSIDMKPGALTGVIRGLERSEDDIWVKLCPVVGTVPTLEQKVGKDLRFEFIGIESGEYLLIVLRGTRVIYFRQLDDSTAHVEVSVGSAN